jgi:copper chaperone
MNAITLKVTGMSCAHCVHAVTKALQGVTGVEKVEVSLDREQAQVWGEPDTGALIAAIAAEGYAATVAEKT